MLLSGGALTAYNFTRPLPVSVEQVAPISLADKKPRETPAPEETENEDPSSQVENGAVKKPVSPGRRVPVAPGNEIVATDPLNIEITDPVSPLSLVPTDTFKVEAAVLPAGREIERVEFFYIRIENINYSERGRFISARSRDEDLFGIYNTEKDVQLDSASLVRMAEVRGAPYEVQGRRLPPGVYALYAMVTDISGIRRISSPRSMTVKAYPPGANPASAGWRRPNRRGVTVWAMTESTISDTMPFLEPCDKLTVTPASGGPEPAGDELLVKEGENIRFRVSAPEGIESKNYEWSVSAGEIADGADPGEIVVKTGGLGGQIVRAIAETKKPDGTIYKACGEAGVSRKTRKNTPGFRSVKTRYPSCRDVAEPLAFDIFLFADKSKINACPRNPDDPLDKSKLLKQNLGTLVGGVYGGELKFKYRVDGGVIAGAGENVVWDLTSVRSVPGEYTAVVEVEDGCQGRAIASKTIHISNYCTPCFEGWSESNLTKALTFKLLNATVTAPEGTESLEYEWSVPGGAVHEGQGRSTILFTGALDRQIPAAENFIETSVKIKGLKSRTGPLSLAYDIATDPNRPELPPEAGERDSFDKFDRNLMWYEWTLSDSTGVVDSGRQAGAARPDLSKLREDGDVILKVKAGGFDRFKFAVDVPPWALAENGPKYEWWSAQGMAVSGRERPVFEITADRSARCDSIWADVKVEGLKPYCINSIRIPAYSDEAHDTNGERIPASMLPGKESRKARTGPPGNGSLESVTSGSTQTTGLSHEPPPPDMQTPGTSTIPVKKEENEYIKVAWPDKPVQVQRSFNIIVTYNRTMDVLEVTDTDGKVIADLTSEIKPIKERWGPDYDVFGYVSLQSDSLYRDGASCGTECRSKVLRLAGPVGEWTFSVTPNIAGNHTFNLELWIEGVNKTTGVKMAAEKVWGINNLAVDVRDDLPTRFHLILSSGFLGMFGLFFVARSIKLGGVKVMIAGGDIVGGHKVGGDLVGGDKIGGDKTENIDSG